MPRTTHTCYRSTEFCRPGSKSVGISKDTPNLGLLGPGPAPWGVPDPPKTPFFTCYHAEIGRPTSTAVGADRETQKWAMLGRGPPLVRGRACPLTSKLLPTGVATSNLIAVGKRYERRLCIYADPPVNSSVPRAVASESG